MSWQGYIDSSLIGSGHIQKAAIISAAGDSVWASSAGFTIKPDELKTIASVFGDKAAEDAAYADGVHIAGERFVVTVLDGDFLALRKGKAGAVVAKTKQAILVGIYDDNTQPGNARATVEALADYLRNSGY